MFSNIHFFVKMNNVDSPEIYFSEIIKKFIFFFLEKYDFGISAYTFKCRCISMLNSSNSFPS